MVLASNFAFAALLVIAGVFGSTAQDNPREQHTTETVELEHCTAWLRGRSPRDDPAFLEVSPTLSCYDGLLAAPKIIEIENWLQATNVDQKVLVVRSFGGTVAESLDLGDVVLQSNVHVVVADVCASSCANYVFLLARSQQVLPDSTILFHGGISPAEIAEAEALTRIALADSKHADVESAVRSITANFEDQLKHQRHLLQTRDIPTQFLEVFGLGKVDQDLDSDCSRGTAERFYFLNADQFDLFGIHPSGVLVDDPETIVASLYSLLPDGADRIEVCPFPEQTMKDLLQ